ncbi:MAG: tetratricopeptide repeat protein, partial [bacterium]
MSDLNQIFDGVRSLIADNKLSEATTKLQELAGKVDSSDEVELRAEYYYLLATANFSSQPHAEVLRQAQAAYELVVASAATELVGRIQALIGKLYVALGDLKSGEEYIRDAISSFRRSDCRSELVLAYNKLAQVYFVRGDFRQAESFLQEAIALMEQDPDASEVSLMKARGNYARIKALLGDWQEAEPILAECVSFSRERQLSVSLAKNLLSLGYVKYLKGDLAAARGLYQEAYAIITALDLIRERSIFHEYMGDLQAALRDAKMARQHYGYALEIGERIAPESAIVSQTERRLAELEMAAANYAKAREHAERARQVAEQVGELIEVAAADKVLATLAARDNDHSTAARLFDAAISTLQTCGCRREQAMAQLAAGRSLLGAPNWRRLAARYLLAAARLAEGLQMTSLRAECYFELSRLEIEAENFDEAVGYLQVCESDALKAGDDALIEECRVLRLNIEDRLIDSGLSSANQFALFNSVVNTEEYGDLKTGDLAESLKILQSRIKADRAFVLALEPDSRAFELLAELSFESHAVGKIAASLGNGRGG